ncbi:hypothetical protein [Novosphingobium beihaiensis]|uniref:Uncharacterized protein n=1 Tax=Novosphingobium beihaiensis TaxID=2930389 RepID=A0ABT0BNG4_9SPHN|nr:hypothetical protein [Novosphingobium beihaiensis]MCJ2186587.1 hypothetical protein [Novosphingobium beihaiensis]
MMMAQEQETQHEEAKQALATISGTKAALADDIANCPPWRHAAFGGMFALLIGAISISSAVQFATIPVIIMLIILIKRSDERRNGVFVHGYRRGKTLAVTLAYLVVLVPFILLALHLRLGGFGLPAKAGLTALAFAIAVGLSLWWHRVFKRELLEDPAA